VKRLATRRRVPGLGGVALALVLALGAPGSQARAEGPAWRQQEVLGLARKLDVVLGEVVAAAREETPQDTALQQRTRDAAVSRFDRVRQAADALVAKLEAGWDRDASEAYFRNLRDVFRETGQVAGDAVPRENVRQKLDEAIGILKQLSRYYPEA